MAPSLGGDTDEYADTSKYVNTLEYLRTRWYLPLMQERLTRQERKTQTRERLIDAAAAVFAEHGFEAATLDEVAAAAGYTKGAVYSNFTSKTDLLIALLERRISSQSAQYSERFEGMDLATAAHAVAAEPGPGMELEKQWVVLAVEFWLHAMHDEKTRLLVAEQYERARGEISNFLVASGYGRDGHEAPLAPRDMAIVIEAIGTGLSLQAALDPAHVDMGLAGRVLVDLLHLPPLPTPEPMLKRD
jgi:AcrR family transcriptional regulator